MCGLRHKGKEWLSYNISAKEALNVLFGDFKLFLQSFPKGSREERTGKDNEKKEKQEVGE